MRISDWSSDVCSSDLAHIGQAQALPEARQHDDELGVDVRAGKAQGLDVDLVELAVAAALRAFVAEYGADAVDALRPVVQQIVLDAGAHHAGGHFGPHGERIDRKSTRLNSSH